MTESRSEEGLVRYYCTAGNGMEPFLMEEVKRKLAAEDVSRMPGKVLFSSSARIKRLSELKAAERLFLLLKQDSPVQLSAHISPAKAASALQSRLLGDRNLWSSAVTTWRSLQEELASRRTTDTQRVDLGIMRTKEEEKGREELEKCAVEPGKSTTKQRERQSENKRLKTSEENGAQTLGRNTEKEDRGLEILRDEERKRKEETSGETFPKAQTVGRKRERDDEEEQNERGMAVKFTGVIPGADFSGGSVCDAAPGLDRTVQSMQNVKSTGRGDQTLLPHSRAEPELPSCFPVTFRISCKCTGSLTRHFSAQEVSRVLGVGLSRLVGWKADLKNPQLEVNVCLSDDHCLLGIPLTRIPLANRSYIQTTGLRSTIAWAMASLAQIQPGFCVVDPMCGVGTILTEAAQEHEAACFLGMDLDDEQLQKGNRNVEFAKLGNRIHLLKASCMVLPLPSASVDAVVCDLPFGRKFGTKTNMAASLPFIVTEMERILCIGGTLVLLLSPQLSCLLKKLLAQKNVGSMSNLETKPETGLKDCPSPSLSSTKQPTLHQGVKSSSDVQHRVTRSVSTLKHQATLRVSLGAIDGLIHKYVKTDG